MKKTDVHTENAGNLAVHIMMNGWHQPFVGGKANRNIAEEMIVQGIYRGTFPPFNSETVELALNMIDDLIELHAVRA